MDRRFVAKLCGIAVILPAVLAFAGNQRTAAPAAKPARAAQEASQQKQAVAEAHEMAPEALVQARKADRRILIIDVREPAQYGAGHVEDSINVPVPQLRRRTQELRIPKKVEIVTMCGTPACSSRAAAELMELGYTQVSYCPMSKWDAAGLPKVSSKPTPQRRKAH